MKKLLAALCATVMMHGAEPEVPRWFKGNLHTHSLWSDGDDFPEMIVDWYKKAGYHFLAISDHNTLNEGERWSFVATNRLKQAAFDKYVARFGTNWVQTREQNGRAQVRLKPLSEYAPLFQEAERFLLIPSEEITDKYKRLPVASQCLEHPQLHQTTRRRERPRSDAKQRRRGAGTGPGHRPENDPSP